MTKRVIGFIMLVVLVFSLLSVSFADTYNGEVDKNDGMFILEDKIVQDYY